MHAAIDVLGDGSVAVSTFVGMSPCLLSPNVVLGFVGVGGGGGGGREGCAADVSSLFHILHAVSHHIKSTMLIRYNAVLLLLTHQTCTRSWPIWMRTRLQSTLPPLFPPRRNSGTSSI